MDKAITCLECDKVFLEESSLHRHIKAHKMSQRDYYFQHFPRWDKLDGMPIEFKNKEYYFEHDFNSRANLRDWVYRVSPEEAKTYVRQLLIDRKRRKNLTYAPCQVELRSLPMPGMAYMNKLFGNYYDEALQLGFKLKCDTLRFDGNWQKFHVEHKVICDTREQMPLSFNELKTMHQGLKFGDYKLNDDIFSHSCCIERKSIGDFYGTLTQGYARFCNELDRAQQAGFYLIVIIEGLYEDVVGHTTKLKQISTKHPEYAMHNMRNLCQNYPMLQFLFVENRDEASEVILKLFQSNGQFKKIDLQYAYDTGNLI